MNRGNNGFEGNAEVLCRRYPPRLPARKASSSALPKAPALPQNSKGPPRRRRGRFARPQGEGWLPPAEAENAANVALRLPGSAVSPCLPMLASVNRGNNGFEGNAEVLCRRYPPRLPARKASSSALPKAPALPQNSKGPPRRRRGRFARPQGEGWLPPAEAENAANVALRLPGSAVSPCLPMLMQSERIFPGCVEGAIDTANWDANQYLKFKAERTQPARDLPGRIAMDGECLQWVPDHETLLPRLFLIAQ